MIGRNAGTGAGTNARPLLGSGVSLRYHTLARSALLPAISLLLAGIASSASSASAHGIDGGGPGHHASASCEQIVALHTVPATPRTGTLFRLRVVVRDSSAIVVGTLNGEPLHFRARGDTLETFAPMPVDSAAGVTALLTCSDRGSDMATLREARIAAVGGNYRLERLSVAPRFGAPPDSATAARMQREAERAAEVSRASHATPRMWQAAFAAPRESRITSGFGHGRTFNGTVTSRHMGTDYAGAVGAPVKAVNRGVVRIVDAFHLGGNVIYLDHGEGVVTAYLHLSRQRVAVGDTVARGQIIGSVGATGRVTGPHLHLIARIGSVSIDPLSLIGKR